MPATLAPMNARVRLLLAAAAAVARARAAAPAASARDVDRAVLRRRADQRELLPGAGPRARPEGADHPRDPRLGRHPRQGREQRHARARRARSALGPLRRAGFNVLTWDSRGFGESGGTVEVDSQDFEGRDVSALLDWLATQPEQQLDAAGDPRAGMTGASYAGGIELVAAGIDRRIDAIAPDDRVALAAHRALPRRPRQGRLGGRALGPRHPHRDGARRDQPRGRADRHGRPARRSPRSPGGAGHRPPVGREPRLVREPRPGRRARLAASASRRCSCRAPPTRSSRPARRSATSS